jgi:hypothetical protein
MWILSDENTTNTETTPSCTGPGSSNNWLALNFSIGQMIAFGMDEQFVHFGVKMSKGSKFLGPSFHVTK